MTPPPRVKSKAAAEQQITVEQLVRDAQEYKDTALKPAMQRVVDEEELLEYRAQKRRFYEDRVRNNRYNIANYLQYAEWEENQREFDHARSVYERAIDVEYRNVTIWRRYVEMEMRTKQINHARNLWDRMTDTLPNVKDFWYKYIHFEEMLGNVVGARKVFERWMKWEPDLNAWMSFVRFELKFGSKDGAKEILRRFIAVHNNVAAWLKYAKIVEKQLHDPPLARQVYDSAMESLEDESNDVAFYKAFAEFEARNDEHERARAIFKYALDHLDKADAERMYAAMIAFEKQNGNEEAIDDVVNARARMKYEDRIQSDATNYDIWLCYVRLEELQSRNDSARVREVYERAIGEVPELEEKRWWRRYIYIWIKYALYEELTTCAIARARAVYKAALDVVPHKKFTFGKLWILAGKLELRQRNLTDFRKIFGRGIGMTGKRRIFQYYIGVEERLGNFERCRTLYEKWLQTNPSSADIWSKYAGLENTIGDTDRARAIFDMGVGVETLDFPELLWKRYIDFEAAHSVPTAVGLYERLLDRTQHVQVFISYAQFLHERGDGDVGSKEAVRAVFKRGSDELRSSSASGEDRSILLESWRQYESEFGDQNSTAEVTAKMPKRMKKRRKLRLEGGETIWEEVIEFKFPEDEERGAKANVDFLAAARKWKSDGGPS